MNKFRRGGNIMNFPYAAVRTDLAGDQAVMVIGQEDNGMLVVSAGGREFLVREWQLQRNEGAATPDLMQVAGNHYKGVSSDMQHWNIVAAHKLDYFQGQITKYVMRWKLKNGVEDLRKARHYLDKYIELQAEDAGAEPTRNYVGQG